MRGTGYMIEQEENCPDNEFNVTADDTPGGKRRDFRTTLQLPFVMVSQPALKDLMTFEEWLNTPPVWRLWTSALSRMNNGGHAVFDRGELMMTLGSGGVIDKHTGELSPIVPMSPRQLQRLGKRLIDGGYAADVKSLGGSVCVQVNGAVAQQGRHVGGSWKCEVHRTYKRAYVPTGAYVSQDTDDRTSSVR
jgi:hypothetical protein